MNGDPEFIKLHSGQKKAFEKWNNYADYIIQKFRERFYFTKGHGCMGGFCELREYKTFFGNAEVVIYTLLYPNQTELQSELSEKLFLSFYIDEVP